MMRRLNLDKHSDNDSEEPTQFRHQFILLTYLMSRNLAAIVVGFVTNPRILPQSANNALARLLTDCCPWEKKLIIVLNPQSSSNRGVGEDARQKGLNR